MVPGMVIERLRERRGPQTRELNTLKMEPRPLDVNLLIHNGRRREPETQVSALNLGIRWRILGRCVMADGCFRKSQEMPEQRGLHGSIDRRRSLRFEK